MSWTTYTAIEDFYGNGNIFATFWIHMRFNLGADTVWVLDWYETLRIRLNSLLGEWCARNMPSISCNHKMRKLCQTTYAHRMMAIDSVDSSASAIMQKMAEALIQLNEGVNPLSTWWRWWWTENAAINVKSIKRNSFMHVLLAAHN